MPVELEAKFLEIDRDEMRQKLQAAGYHCSQPNYLMRRVVFDLPGDVSNAWARVRDEAGLTTISYKRTHSADRVDGTEEIQITADSFENAAALLAALGLIRKSYQETWREVWVKDRIELTLDEWPAVPPFCEIEAPDTPTLQAAAAELGLVWESALFGPVSIAYARYGIPEALINAYPLLTFATVDELRAAAKVA